MDPSNLKLSHINKVYKMDRAYLSLEEYLSRLNETLTMKPITVLKNEEFVSEIGSGRVKFLTVVESIQGVLNNENVTVRERGIEYLSWLLSEIPGDLFTFPEIAAINNFYCNCLNWSHNIIPPTVRGLLALVKMKEIWKNDIIKMLEALFRSVNCQTQLQPDRYNIYSILKFVVENHLDEIKAMGPDFVFGVISFVEGEADPACLILLFNFLPFFIKNYSLGHLAEEVFEVLSCYFPIDFNAAAQETLTITREDLSEGLLHCLSASESFSEQSLPLILEKVDSSYKTAKTDSYKLLQKCCKTMKATSLEKHLPELWKSLAKDVLPGNDKHVSDAGLAALTDVVHLLSLDESHQAILHTFLDDILTTVKSLINRIDENMFQPAIRVLAAVCARSKWATTRILRHLKSFIQPQPSTTLMEKKIILSSFLPFLRFCHEYQMQESDDPDALSSYLELVDLYLLSTTVVDCEVRKLAFVGILELLPDLSQDFKRRLYQIVIDNIKMKDDIRTSDEFLKIWRLLAQNGDSEFHDILSKTFSTSKNEEHLPRLLWALSFIADLPNFTGFVIPIFLNFVVGLESLLNACRFAKTTNSIDFFPVIHSQHNILERLISWCLESNSEELRDGKTLVSISEIIALLVRNQSPDVQQAIVDKFTLMLLGESPALDGGGDALPPTNNLTSSSPETVRKVSILEAILGSVRPETKIPMLSTIRENLTDLALTSTDDSVRLSSSRLLGIFVNKCDSDLLPEISRDISARLESSDSRLKLNAAFLFTWVVKGVILRGGPSSEEWISTWFDLLGREDVGERIAEGFRTVIEEDDLYLNLESHSNVRVLYRQRLFGSHMKLVKLYETSEESVKMNYLLALVRLLQGVPVHLIKMEIWNIITIFVRCLDSDKPEVLLTSLEILAELLQSREKIFSDHIHNFVPKFLKLAGFEGYMKIRMNALKCLYHYGYYPTVDLLPIKNQVIRELECCLDDKKRLARKEAVRARCRWFLVGAPGEDVLDS